MLDVFQLSPSFQLTSVIAFVGTIPQVQSSVIQGSYTLHRFENKEGHVLESHKEEGKKTNEYKKHEKLALQYVVYDDSP